MIRWLAVDPGLTSSGFYFREGTWQVSHTIAREKNEDRYAYLHRMGQEVEAHDAHTVDLAIVEDYPYRMPGRTMAAAAEAGGVVRAAFAAHHIPWIAIPIETWKAATHIRLPKNTNEQKTVYCHAAGQLARLMFDSTDAADAFLLWYTVQRILEDRVFTVGAQRIREKLRGLMPRKEEMLPW